MNQTIHDHKPPRIPRSLLRWYCKPELLEDIEGDIHEDFNKRYTRSGARYARFYYALDVIRFFRPFAIRSFPKTQMFNTMFKINTRIAFRNLAKNKLYSFINITGLAIGVAACLIIAQYVNYQLSFDKYHQDADNIFRVHTTSYQNGEYLGTGIYCGYALASALGEDVPEIKKYSRIHPEYGGAIMNTVTEGVEGEPYRENDILYVEPAFLEMYSVNLNQGNPATALNDMNSILISTSMAKKYFGDDHTSAIGKNIRASGSWGNGLLQVTGVFNDIPSNSHLKFDFLKPISKVVDQNEYNEDGTKWGWTNFFMFVQTEAGTTESGVEAKMVDLMHKYNPEDLERSSMKSELSLQPLTDLHLKSVADDGDGDFGDSRSIDSIYFLSLIAAFILIIAWINFINLSTAKASERGLEVGVKKAMGAFKPQLIAQFLTESFWINFLAIAIAVGLATLLLPVLGETINEPLALEFDQPLIPLSIIGLVLIGPLLAGMYPAFVLSSFKTVNALKGTQGEKQRSRFSLRKVLVVFQFVISTLLVAGTFVVSKQLEFMRNGDTGLDMSEILVIKGPSVGVTKDKFNTFKNAMSAFAQVEHLATSRSIPGNGFNFGTTAYNATADQSSEKRIDVTWIDKNFMDTYGMELLAGRDFSDASEDVENGALVSEAAVQAYNLGTLEEAVNSKLIISGDTVAVRGVIKDHNWQSLHQSYLPSAFLYIPGTVRFFSLKIDPRNSQSVIKEAEEQFNTIFEGNPLDYFFLDDFFNRQYQQDQEFRTIFNAFASFAIFAACLGLFGLAAYTVLRKAKEIGIRKVLGASNSSITLQYSKRYMLLILIANLISIPIAYFGMKRWLEDFAFSIPITAELFILPILLLAIIAATTISFQTVKAAMANPVNNLRSE